MFTINAFKCMILIWFIVKVHKVDSFENYTFRCEDGGYINDKKYCDGKNDCEDKSDEKHPSCNRGRCPESFRCDEKCSSIRVRCNMQQDCLDGSDEMNCGDEIIINNCTQEQDKYLCDDKLRCIDLVLTCDYYCHCFDCSDEKSECWDEEKKEEYTKKAYPHTCFSTPNGPHCCSEFDPSCYECDLYKCEQKCETFKGEFGCLCDENYIYVLESGYLSCVNNETRNNTLIFSTINSIAVLDLFTNSSRLIREEIDVTALTSAHDNVYYATFNNSYGHIFKTSIASNETHEIIISGSKITSLAIDWITNQTYYSTNTSSIIACSKDGKLCKQLESGNAHSIVLAPRFGLLFWVKTVESSQHIMKSAMDGSDKITLRSYESFYWPITISADETTETIYFWTGIKEISAVSFSGNFPELYLAEHSSTIDRTLFTVFEKQVYFSFMKSHKIRLATNDQSQLSLPTQSIQFSDPKARSITHLYAYNPKLQRTKIANPCADVCIDGLCLLRPSPSKTILNYTCFHEGFIVPSEHSNENGNTTDNVTKTSRGSSFEDIMLYVLVAVLLVSFLFFIGRYLFIRWKKELFKNDESTVPHMSLKSCKNNELLIDTE